MGMTIHQAVVAPEIITLPTTPEEVLLEHMSLGIAPVDGGFGGYTYHCTCPWSETLDLTALDDTGGPLGLIDTLTRRFVFHQVQMLAELGDRLDAESGR